MHHLLRGYRDNRNAANRFWLAVKCLRVGITVCRQNVWVSHERGQKESVVRCLFMMAPNEQQEGLEG